MYRFRFTLLLLDKKIVNIAKCSSKNSYFSKFLSRKKNDIMQKNVIVKWGYFIGDNMILSTQPRENDRCSAIKNYIDRSLHQGIKKLTSTSVSSLVTGII